MNRTPKLNQSSLPVAPPEVTTQALDVDELLAKCGTILQREIRNLLIASISGKLDRAQSQDLVAYVKLLTETKIAMQDAVANMSDAELEKAVKS